MKKPNGWGSVYKLKGSRRNPWAARKTIGFKDKGHPIRLFVGFYPTRVEAEKALAAYNAKPYDKKTTFGECADAWFSETTIRETTKRSYKSASEKCVVLRDMKMADIHLADMQAILDKETKPSGRVVKVFLSQVFDYAVRHEVISAERFQSVRFLQLSEDEGRKTKRSVFTQEEIDKVTDPLIMILIYTGMRVSEMLSLRAEDIHLEERWLYVSHSKTPSGIRVVPIAEKIVPFMSALPTNIKYDTFKDSFFRQTGHLPHDARHTFVSMCANKGIDPRVTKSIVGHTGTDITETVYTHINLSLLLEAVNSL